MKNKVLLSLVIFAVLPAVLAAEEIELLAIGDFSELGKSGAQKHWTAAGFAGTEAGNSLEWINAGGDRVFARISSMSENTDRRYFVCKTRKPIQINQSWDTLKLKAVYRIEEIDPLPASWQNFRFAISWFDDMGNNVTPTDGSGFFLRESETTDGWKVGEATVEKPPSATSFTLDFGSQGAGLVADVVQISLQPVGVSIESTPIPAL